jgi:hypothetical protein
MPHAVGRRSHRPWGVPERIWEAARKSAERAGYIWNPEAIVERLPKYLSRERARPWFVPPKKRTRYEDEPRMNYIVERVIATPEAASPATRRMAEAGLIPGVYWDHCRGLVKIEIVATAA